MNVQGIVWLGVRTSNFDELTHFFRKVMGIRVADETADFGRFQLPNNDQLEVFGTSSGAQPHFTTGPVPEFLVDDIHEAVAELEAAGIEIVREIAHWGGDYYSAHLRGPDGNVHGVVSARYYD